MHCTFFARLLSRAARCEAVSHRPNVSGGLCTTDTSTRRQSTAARCRRRLSRLRKSNWSRQRSRPNHSQRRRGVNEIRSSWSIRSGTNRRRGAGGGHGMRIDSRMGSAAARNWAGHSPAGSSAVCPNDRDEADAEGGGSEGAVVDTGAGLRDSGDLVAQPVRLPRRQGLYRQRAPSGSGWQLKKVNEIAWPSQRCDREHSRALRSDRSPRSHDRLMTGRPWQRGSVGTTVERRGGDQ